jgi:hypothetical protein
MGTSTNPRLPSTPLWTPATAVLGHLDWAPDRQGTEIWRAALADRNASLQNDLAGDLTAAASRLARAHRMVPTALSSFDTVVSTTDSIGVVVEFARRALAKAVADRSGSSGFAQELFAEAVSYYASRELPSIVGKASKIQTTGSWIALERQLRDFTRARVSAGEQPPSSERAWTTYVSRICNRLRAPVR